MAEETTGTEAGEAPEAQEAGKSKPARKSDTLVVLIIGFLVIILTPLITYFVVKQAAPPGEENEKKTIVAEGHDLILDLRPVNVNIAQTKGTRFLRLDVDLVLSEQGLLEELSGSTSLAVDRVLLAASRRTLDELEGPKGREALKRDIISEINAAIKNKMTGAVIDIYFKEYLIQ